MHSFTSRAGVPTGLMYTTLFCSLVLHRVLLSPRAFAPGDDGNASGAMQGFHHLQNFAERTGSDEKPASGAVGFDQPGGNEGWTFAARDTAGRTWRKN